MDYRKTGTPDSIRRGGKEYEHFNKEAGYGRSWNRGSAAGNRR